jgi:N-acetyl-anhydromuramyl-L-alanine amidase AmpD
MHKKISAALAAALVTALGATAAHAQGLEVLWLKTENRTESARKISKVDYIVVHVAQGSFWGAVNWLRNPRAHGSSHYVVSMGGDVVQLVSTSDVAWHAGNRLYNRRSIGIEHEGFVERGGFTDEMYRSSARLVAYLAKRAGMPIDREHIIGHHEVPDPDGNGFGGGDGHTDPGPKWDWDRYMGYVREYAESPEQPVYTKRIPKVAQLPASKRPAALAAAATPAKPKAPAVRPGAVVRGVAKWGVRREGRLFGRGVYRVEFFVDGKLLWRDRTGPFDFARGRGWDSRTVPNGRHLLTAKIYGRKGYRMTKRYPVRVDNSPIELELTGIAPESGVRGEVKVGVEPSYPIERVVLYADGKPVSRDASEPYELHWDSSGAEEGPHELIVYARTAGGRRSAKVVPVVVANGELPQTLGVALSVPDAVPVP